MAHLAARIYGGPAAEMTMYAVTGTNGKTTTSYLLDAALRADGQRTGVIGTIGFLLDGRPLESTRTTITTPESPDLQALLAVLVEAMQRLRKLKGKVCLVNLQPRVKGIIEIARLNSVFGICADDAEALAI